MAGSDGNAAGQTGGNLTIEQVNEAIAKALKPVADGLSSLTDNQKVIADTLAKLPPAAVAEKKEGADAPKALTADDVAKLVNDGLAAKLAEQQQTSSQKSLVQRFVDELRGKKVPDEIINAHLPQAGDEAALTAASTKAVERWNALASPKKEDVGGASKEGGQTAKSDPAGAGGFLKMPVGPATAA